MPSQKNIKQLEELKEKLKKAKSVFFSDYSGLSVSEINQLRSKIVEAGGDFKVAKNSLIKLALGKDSTEIEKVLSGPTAALFAYEDEIQPLKTLWNFKEDTDKEKLQLKAGFLDKQFLNKDRAIKLAQLPGLEQLQAKAVGMIASPLSGLVNTLNGNLRNLTVVLSQIKESKAAN